MNEKEEFSEALYLRVKSSPSSWAAREIQRLQDEVARLEKELMPLRTREEERQAQLERFSKMDWEEEGQ